MLEEMLAITSKKLKRFEKKTWFAHGTETEPRGTQLRAPSGGHQLFKASHASDVQLGIKKGCACSSHRHTRDSFKAGLLNTARYSCSSQKVSMGKKPGNSWGIR